MNFSDSDLALIEAFQTLAAARLGVAVENLTPIPDDVWDMVQYPSAGANQLVFFQHSQGADNTATSPAITNMPQPGTIQDPFLFLGVGFGYYIPSEKFSSYVGTDATAFCAELLNGLTYAGVATISNNDNLVTNIPTPMLDAADPAMFYQRIDGGITSLTLTAGTPNTLASEVGTNHQVLTTEAHRVPWRFDPGILVFPNSKWSVNINYTNPGSGAGAVLPVIPTSIVNDSTNPLYIRAKLYGVRFQKAG